MSDEFEDLYVDGDDDDEDAGASDDGSPSGRADVDPVESALFGEVSIDDLVDREGVTGLLARELVQAREERKARAAAEAAAAAAEEALKSGEFDWTDQASLDVLRSQVSAERAAAFATAQSLALAQVAAQAGENGDPIRAAQEAALFAEAAAFEARAADPLLHHPEYRERDLADWQQRRAVEVGNKNRTILDEAADAQAYVDAMLAAARGVE